VDAVILDELGYLPFPASGSAVLAEEKKGLDFSNPLNYWCARSDSNARPLGS